jgi:DNA (cytosine-5)-methyltransferase 1
MTDLRGRTLGGSFSGIGGFERSWQRHGGRVAWMCEIDPAARKVLETRFPGVPVYPDIMELDPAEVEPVDVFTGGSPCQGFSIAGARTGLEHVESRLFADYVRVMEGLADRGLKYALWENVPGVLSISNDDGERTFPHVVAALVGADRPVHLNGGARWNSGLADRGGRAVAWRVVDSRHFGVPQRRRRVYACVAFGGVAADRAGRALLAKPEGVSGDSAACRQTREAASAGVGAGAQGVSENQRGELRLTGYSRAVTSGGGKPGQGYPAVMVPEVAGALGVTHGVDDLDRMTMREGKDGGGKGPLLSEDESLTLATGNGQVLFEPTGVALRGRDGGATAELGEVGTAHTIRASQGGGDKPHALTAYGVRRLTPVECERLQGFPDGWTEPAGSDSARYRALGNAVTVNVPAWLFARLDWKEDTA